MKVLFCQDEYFYLIWCFEFLSRHRLVIDRETFLLCLNMSSHQTNKDKPRALISDNQVSALKEQTDFQLCSVQPDRTIVLTDFNYLSANCKFCRLSCCNPCTYCKRAATKERCKSSCCKTSVIKICEPCFLCQSSVFCNKCTKCPNCCSRSAFWGKTKPVLGNLGSLGGRT